VIDARLRLLCSRGVLEEVLVLAALLHASCGVLQEVLVQPWCVGRSAGAGRPAWQLDVCRGGQVHAHKVNICPT
jgi:hypothetical protein